MSFYTLPTTLLKVAVEFLVWLFVRSRFRATTPSVGRPLEFGVVLSMAASILPALADFVGIGVLMAMDAYGTELPYTLPTVGLVMVGAAFGGPLLQAIAWLFVAYALHQAGSHDGERPVDGGPVACSRP